MPCRCRSMLAPLGPRPVRPSNSFTALDIHERTSVTAAESSSTGAARATALENRALLQQLPQFLIGLPSLQTNNSLRLTGLPLMAFLRGQLEDLASSFDEMIIQVGGRQAEDDKAAYAELPFADEFSVEQTNHSLRPLSMLCPSAATTAAELESVALTCTCWKHRFLQLFQSAGQDAEDNKAACAALPFAHFHFFSDLQTNNCRRAVVPDPEYEMLFDFLNAHRDEIADLVPSALLG